MRFALNAVVLALAASAASSCSNPATTDGGARPSISSVSGNDGVDGTRVLNGLVVRGENLAQSSFDLRTGAAAGVPLSVARASDTEVEVLLPADVRSGSYTLLAANLSGTASAPVVLQLPELTGDQLVDRVNTQATTRLATTVLADEVVTSTELDAALASMSGKAQGDLALKLTGTVQVLASSSQVLGTGTTFTAELWLGAPIRIEDEVLTVASIVDDTHLNLSSAAVSTHGAAGGAEAFTDHPLFHAYSGANQSRFLVQSSGASYFDVGGLGNGPGLTINTTNSGQVANNFVEIYDLDYFGDGVPNSQGRKGFSINDSNMTWTITSNRSAGEWGRILRISTTDLLNPVPYAGFHDWITLWANVPAGGGDAGKKMGPGVLTVDAEVRATSYVKLATASTQPSAADCDLNNLGRMVHYNQKIWVCADSGAGGRWYVLTMTLAP